ncbi:MAG: methyltransferase domain-containing protein [Synechococcaceae cyanobacterium]|nr:methyltransferase domain-containing protein [Synechococcaceae cyanobacterium]
MSGPLTKFIYRTLQGGKLLAAQSHKQLAASVMALLEPEVSARQRFTMAPELRSAMQSSIDLLMERDWHDAMHGVYPVDLLFDIPWLDWAGRYPSLWLDLPNTWSRIRRRDVATIPEKINRQDYPRYYLQNFHYQTDGYLSDHSASLYDLQVEILFSGMTDAMRRRILSPIRRWRDSRPSTGGDAPLRILDVATGTGRAMRQLRAAFPRAELTGIDLSPAYLREARRGMANLPGAAPQLMRANADALPFEAETFDVVSCVFLFHELPRPVRAQVARECLRVLRPGGLMVMADSIQKGDYPAFSSLLELFPRSFHEPFFGDYIHDQIDRHLVDAGFQNLEAECHFMTKIWSGLKPAVPCATPPRGSQAAAAAARSGPAPVR